MLKTMFYSILMIVMLSACSSGESFFHQIDEIEQALEQNEWIITTEQAEALKELYDKHLWKLQLLGDETEYENLYMSINKLIAAAKEKDPLSVRLELATSRTILEEIYSF